MPHPAPPASPTEPALTVVGIGASAGGLDACQKLVAAIPRGAAVAWIVVQHLDPSHETLMADLLSTHTSLPVMLAIDGALLMPGQIHVIPAGRYLAVQGGRLVVSAPTERHGARLPFDYLLHAMARDCGVRAVCVVLSGSGADGSLGLAAVKAAGGRVYVQDPVEADYDGMPDSAIATGLVDLVLPVAQIPAAILRGPSRPRRDAPDTLGPIIDLLRAKTAHDFTLYKTGTLRRRIERRMALLALEPAQMTAYLEVLRGNPLEIDLLAKDLLINVTSFFRDHAVFDHLAAKVLPDLVRAQPIDQALRVWIAGCSTGEEAYSLGILFREAIAAADRPIKLQIFASDVDADAVAQARDGVYPETIESDVSPARLARHFTKSEGGYRVVADLRAQVVFTVQDVLIDPPFSRIDFVSCRNLLIYLGPEAQARAMALFHFALRPGGLLLLGKSETPGQIEGRFEVVAKSERLYRHIGRSRPGELQFLMGSAGAGRSPLRLGSPEPPNRQIALADLIRRLVLDRFAPAAVLVNAGLNCLYLSGPTDRYLRVPPGMPSHDLMAMLPQDSRIRLRSAIHRALGTGAAARARGGKTLPGDLAYDFDVRPVRADGEDLLLIAFVDRPPEPEPVAPGDPAQQSALAAELALTKIELEGAIHSLERSTDEQKSIIEEALSINEEYQSTNEELLTSKEELQSLNEELTALNLQLQETLERQRITANDLQNVLYSTDIATLFLDTTLCIRFFTPATQQLFHLIPGDIGRPLADLRATGPDADLADDAARVLRELAPIEREIRLGDAVWFLRRILPYRGQDGGVEGVVITFSDITDRKNTAQALEQAKLAAEQATIAKTRFLVAASHDLRQPLQSLTLLQGLLAKTAQGAQAQELVALLNPSLNSMSEMLNTLLDLNQIDAGLVQPLIEDFALQPVLAQLCDEFGPVAADAGIRLRVVPTSLSVCSDPRLLEQILRNLLSNALKYTQQGRVLLGCRRRGGQVVLQVWDTGIGIPGDQFGLIFDEYHQIDNPGRERSRGLGLGLSIVRRLGEVLDHPLAVDSKLDRGSVFSVTVPRAAMVPPQPANAPHPADHRTGHVLVIEDDPDLRALLQITLAGEGHRVTALADGAAALAFVAQPGQRPDLILTDYNLPRGLTGLQIAARLRDRLGDRVPVVILTGDISTRARGDVAADPCVQLAKPVKLGELTRAIQRLLALTPLHAPARATIFVVDDDRAIRDALGRVLRDAGHDVQDFATAEACLAAPRPPGPGCLLVDAALPGLDGIDLISRLRDLGQTMPAIVITGHSDVPIAVRAMRAGASDFIEKPIRGADLLSAIQRSLDEAQDSTKLTAWREAAAAQLAALTDRQRQILDRILAGHPSKNIAADLGISQRTVESHRAAIMKRAGVKSLPALARLAQAALPPDPTRLAG